MKKLMIKIGNKTHELPYNGETFSFEVKEHYVPKVGDCVKIYFKNTGYEYYGKISQIEQTITTLKSAISEISKLVKKLCLYYNYSDIFFTQITPEELKAKYAEAGYYWDYESDTIKLLKWMPKEGNKVWFLDVCMKPVNFIFSWDDDFHLELLEKNLLFQTEEKCKEFSDHCLKYFDKK